MTQTPMNQISPPDAPVADTARLTLRRLTPDDAPFMLALLNDPAFVRFVGDRGVRTVDQARTYLENGAIDSYRRLGFGLYLVEVKDTHEAAGICGLVKRPALDDVDIGFAFLPPFRGRGYAAESARAVVDHARALGLPRLVAIVSPGNDASVRVLTGLDMRFERRIALGAADEVELFSLELQA